MCLHIPNLSHRRTRAFAGYLALAAIVMQFFFATAQLMVFDAQGKAGYQDRFWEICSGRGLSIVFDEREGSEGTELEHDFCSVCLIASLDLYSDVFLLAIRAALPLQLMHHERPVSDLLGLSLFPRSGFARAPPFAAVSLSPVFNPDLSLSF